MCVLGCWGSAIGVVILYLAAAAIFSGPVKHAKQYGEPPSEAGLADAREQGRRLGFAQGVESEHTRRSEHAD